MKWSKRLKWIRISKIVIPIALAISIIFAGFSIFANEAKNFVVEIDFNENVQLSLTYNRNLSGLTDHLDVPVLGNYDDVTWDPSVGKGYSYPTTDFINNGGDPQLPDDIALYDGVHTVFSAKDVVAFFSFSFYLVNSSPNEVNVNMSINIDQVVKNNNAANAHIDEAIRVMVIEDETLLSDPLNRDKITVYKKKEKTQKLEDDLKNDTHAYSNDYSVVNFTDTCVMKNLIPLKLAPGSVSDRSNVKRFTIVLWLEGYDNECTNAIYDEALKMSMTFKGYL